MDFHRCSALVLAGGHSRRMGQDKALLSHRGRPLLRYLVEVAQSCCEPVAVVTPWVDRYRSILPADCGLIPETPAPWADAHTSSGPLWGFHQGLTGLLDCMGANPWVLLLACDLPHLTAPTVQGWLPQLAALPPQTLALLPPHPKGWDPLCGFYHRDCGPLLGAFLQEQGRSRPVSFQAWLRQGTIAPHIQPLAVADRRVLLNCNTPADWQGV